MARRSSHSLLVLVPILFGCGDDPAAPGGLRIFDCTAGTAYAVGETTTGSLTSDDCNDVAGQARADYYQFTVAASGPIAITVETPAGADPFLATLFRPGRTIVDSEATSAHGRAIIGGNLAAGTYILAIRGQGAGDSGDYTITSSATPLPPFDCTVVTPHTIGTSTEGTLVPSDCAKSDGNPAVDYYQFTLSGDGPVAITTRLTRGTTLIDLALIDADGDTLDAYIGGPSEVTVGRPLDAGTYFIAVASRGPAALEEYTLSSAPTLPPFAGCTAITPYAVGTTMAGSLASTDCPFSTKHADFYDFTLTSPGPLSVTLTPAGSETLIIALFHERDFFVASYQSTHEAPATVGRELPVGRYIIAVIATAPGQTADYSFASSPTLPPPPPPFFGCTRSASYVIGSEVQGAHDASDCVHDGLNALDRYDFTLAESRTITFEQEATSSFAPELMLFDAAGAVIARDEWAGSGPRSTLTLTLDPGAYSIGAGSFGGHLGTYTLTTR